MPINKSAPAYHVHLVVVPSDKEQLAQSIGEAHRRYTRYINFRENWKGYLWQGRFSSNPMDEDYLHSTVRYVELNPVKARLVDVAEEWRWSSARAHLRQEDDGIVTRSLCSIELKIGLGTYRMMVVKQATN